MAEFLFNENRIKKVLKNFYILTGIPTCMYDTNFCAITYYGESPDYCEKMRCNSAINLKCLSPDKHFAEECVKQNKFITYTCHAGISETVAPLFYDNVLVGYLLFGGIKDKEKKAVNISTVTKACEIYGLDCNEFIPLYKKLKSFDSESLAACRELLEICLKYIISEKYIKLDDSLLSAKIISYINENYKKPINHEMLCKEFYIGKNYLYKLLKDETGQTLNNYLTSIRMKKARILLEQSNLSVADIAYQVGFSDYNYFIKVFKKYYHIPPLQYRKKGSIINVGM